MSKRTVNKKLRDEERQAIGAIYKQYIDTFQDIPTKTFVKSSTLYAEQEKEDNDKGQIYKPSPIVKPRKDTPVKPTPNDPFPQLRKREKKNSNLKSLGDELKMLQHERQCKDVKFPPDYSTPLAMQDIIGDYSNSTNLFVSNLAPHVTEDYLIELFGNYGALASVKIMWPRGEDISRSANCGFVAFMCRSDAERALNALKSRGDMKINWGKSIKIPVHPIHIPPPLYQLYSPPPPSGLPFNAQIVDSKSGDNVLEETVIKVTIPFERNRLMLIHRTIEFVLREGPEFELLIIDAELENPDFSFLTDNKNPLHTYYRWKLFSILQGESKNVWSMSPFRMFKNGSIWFPPTAPNYKEGMPRELFGKKDVSLSETQFNRLNHLIKTLNMSRESIRGAMVFCLNHASAIDDIFEVITDSLKTQTANPLKKISRLYLFSDVLNNCKNKNVSCKKVPECCVKIFKQLHEVYVKLREANDKEIFKIKVLKVLRAWMFMKVLEPSFTSKLESVFLYNVGGDEDDDNSSLNDEPLDGANLLKRSIQNKDSDCFIVKRKGNKENFMDMFQPLN